MEEAGYRVAGDTGSALVAHADGVGFYFWAFEGSKALVQPLKKAIADEGYRLLDRFSGVPAYTDGVRLAWYVQGLYVWLEGPINSADDIEEDVINALVVASANEGYAPKDAS